MGSRAKSKKQVATTFSRLPILAMPVPALRTRSPEPMFMAARHDSRSGYHHPRNAAAGAGGSQGWPPPAGVKLRFFSHAPCMENPDVTESTLRFNEPFRSTTGFSSCARRCSIGLRGNQFSDLQQFPCFVQQQCCKHAWVSERSLNSCLAGGLCELGQLHSGATKEKLLVQTWLPR